MCIMDDAVSQDIFIPDDIVQPMLSASGCSSLKKALDCLIETAKTPGGRSDLASKDIIAPALRLCESLLSPSHQDLLFSSLKLVRNLCAGEVRNQNLFVENNGARVISRVVQAARLSPDSDNDILRMLLQVLGNVSLAGEEQQLSVWRQFFPFSFLEIARVRNKEVCDTLCMVIYTCSEGCKGLRAGLCADSGLEIIIEIIRTVTADGFREDWFKLLLARVCLEEPCFSSIFTKLSRSIDGVGGKLSKVNYFGVEQAFLLGILSEIVNDQIGDLVVSNDFSLSILGILRNSIETVDFSTKGISNLPTGFTNVDVMGFSLTILRDICACDDPEISSHTMKSHAADTLESAGLIELLITLLRELEPPAIIRKAMFQSEDTNGMKSCSTNYCPYKGFRRDVVSIIGNCCYRRKHVQDKVREINGIVLLLQQCVVDEENPFLREWGMWSVSNVLEGNTENMQFVANLELQGTVEVPELAQMGLRVEVDPKTRRAKLVNAS